MPKELPTFKLTSIESLKITEITNKLEKMYCDKKIFFKAKIMSEGKCFSYMFLLFVKENHYICVERASNNESGLISDYITHTQSYQQMFLQQFFERRIDLVLLGHGNLLKYKELAVITVPKRIKEK